MDDIISNDKIRKTSNIVKSKSKNGLMELIKTWKQEIKMWR